MYYCCEVRAFPGVCKRNVKSFLSHEAHWAALISVFLDTSLHWETMDMGLVHRTVCLFMSQLSLVLIVPIHRGMARLS